MTRWWTRAPRVLSFSGVGVARAGLRLALVGSAHHHHHGLQPSGLKGPSYQKKHVSARRADRTRAPPPSSSGTRAASAGIRGGIAPTECVIGSHSPVLHRTRTLFSTHLRCIDACLGIFHVSFRLMFVFHCTTRSMIWRWYAPSMRLIWADTPYKPAGENEGALAA